MTSDQRSAIPNSKGADKKASPEIHEEGLPDASAIGQAASSGHRLWFRSADHGTSEVN